MSSTPYLVRVIINYCKTYFYDCTLLEKLQYSGYEYVHGLGFT